MNWTNPVPLASRVFCLSVATLMVACAGDVSVGIQVDNRSSRTIATAMVGAEVRSADDDLVDKSSHEWQPIAPGKRSGIWHAMSGSKGDFLVTTFTALTESGEGVGVFIPRLSARELEWSGEALCTFVVVDDPDFVLDATLRCREEE